MQMISYVYVYTRVFSKQVLPIRHQVEHQGKHSHESKQEYYFTAHAKREGLSLSVHCFARRWCAQVINPGLQRLLRLLYPTPVSRSLIAANPSKKRNLICQLVSALMIERFNVEM